MASVPNPLTMGNQAPDAGAASAAPTSPSFPADSMGAFGGSQTQPSGAQDVTGQNAGVFDMLQQVSMGFSQVSEYLMGIAQQFPGSAQAVRSVLEQVQAANTGLVDIVQSVTMEASAPTPAAPRVSY